MDIWAVSYNHNHMRPALGFTQRSSSDGKGTTFGQGSCRVVLIWKVPKTNNVIKLISKLPLVQVLFNSIYGNNCLVIKFVLRSYIDDDVGPLPFTSLYLL